MKRTKDFKSDQEFLEKHLDVVVLEEGSSKLVLSPSLQGRVFTSSADGDEGASFGWINYDLIESGEILKHCNNWGGEDRYWIGPEGGQYAIFFSPGAQFDLDNWQTPASIDTEAWELLSANGKKSVLKKEMNLPNYSGKALKVIADREVVIFDQNQIHTELGVVIPKGVKSVGFNSVNKMTNANDFSWDKKTGMLSIWVLAQLMSTESNTVILPFDKTGAGDILNDTYFGKIDDDRLKVLDEAILYKGDGKKRGKIGIGPSRTKPVIGSFDAENGVLTIVKFSFDRGKSEYVNSMWEHQDDPFEGDVVNSYNDGPLPDGSQMGPFYELETSSAAANLNPGETLTHTHATFHFQGSREELESISKKLLGIGFDECFRN
jgi:hypothetical protein